MAYYDQRTVGEPEFVLVNRGGKLYIRAKPKKWSINQIKARILFGYLAKKGKGLKHLDKKDTPPVAKLIQREMKGVTIGRTLKLKKWQVEFIEWYLRRYVAEQLREVVRRELVKKLISLKI